VARPRRRGAARRVAELAGPLDATVKAARKKGTGTGRIVTYVMTAAGPETVGETTAPPDYEHYVTQQLQPIAEAILRFLDGADFAEIIGARRQLSLFS